MTTRQRLAQLRRHGAPRALCDAARSLTDAVESPPWIDLDHWLTLRLAWDSVTVTYLLGTDVGESVSVVVRCEGQCARVPHTDGATALLVALVSAS